jgi:hypothetical protein
MEDRAGVHVGKDRCIVNVQHLDLTRAGSTPGGSAMAFNYDQSLGFDRDFGSRFHEFVLLLGHNQYRPRWRMG